MRFEITRVSLMDIEGIDDEHDAFLLMRALSKNTEGQSMLFNQRPITYVQHISTAARLFDNEVSSPVEALVPLKVGELRVDVYLGPRTNHHVTVKPEAGNLHRYNRIINAIHEQAGGEALVPQGGEQAYLELVKAFRVREDKLAEAALSPLEEPERLQNAAAANAWHLAASEVEELTTTGTVRPFFDVQPIQQSAPSAFHGGALRPLMKVIRLVGSRPRVHGNGFIQIDLSPTVRLHVWGDPRIPKQDTDTPIHDHTFGFTSYVLVGTLQNIVYEPCPLFREVSHQPHGIVSRQLEDTHLAPQGAPVQLVKARHEIINAGESYSMKPGEIHESIPIGVAVSIIVKDGPTFTQGAPSPLVFAPVGVQPDNEFNRYAHDSELLWSIVADAIFEDYPFDAGLYCAPCANRLEPLSAPLGWAALAPLG